MTHYQVVTTAEGVNT